MKPQLAAAVTGALKERLGACPLMALPPTPAEIARKAALQSGTRQEHLRRAGLAGGAATAAKAAVQPRSLKPVKKAAPETKDAVKKAAPETKDAIARFVAEKGVLRVEPGASGDPRMLLSYLQRKGYAIEPAQRFQYRYRGKLIDAAKLMALADAERAKDGLPPLKRSA